MNTAARVLWSLLAGDRSHQDAITIEGEPNILPSMFGVTRFAAGAVAVATLAVSELLSARSKSPLRGVHVRTQDAAASFRSEALFEPLGWERPAIWDPVAGDYRAADRWLRLHTNYASHRSAALSVLGAAADKSAVAEAVARWDAAALESAIVSAGGCVAAMYSRSEWLAHPHGFATASEPPIALDDDGAFTASTHESGALAADATSPLAGVRVLDLTRVIAGPVCTRFLAAYGADVLRIDPPGFEEVAALLPDTTIGKRCTSLALDGREGAERFEALLAEADVVVHGLRPGALDRLGFDRARLRAKNPALVIATLDAYGWTGPWRERRGFDSLVQMSSGVATAPNGERPSPLPAQALDHGIGYLLAAGVCRALTQRMRTGHTSTVRGSLLGAANYLFTLDDGHSSMSAPKFDDDVFESVDTSWGRARQIRCPGSIDGCPRPSWRRAAGPLGRDSASFEA